MMIGFEAPFWLILLPLILVPFFYRGQKALSHGAFMLLPRDPLSPWLARIERILMMLLILFLILALAKPYLKERRVGRLTHGSNIVLLVDRSSSMNEDFSGKYLAGKSRQTKMVIARALLQDFVSKSQGHLFGMVSFSTAPVEVVGLTADRAFIQASMVALPDRGRGATYIAPALLSSLEMLKHAPSGQRIVLLITDGATQIEPELRARIERLFDELNVRLYWLYLRSRHAPSLAKPNARSTVSPAFALHNFFRQLGERYRLFETQNRQTLAEALREVQKLTTESLHHIEIHPRFRLERTLLLLALITLTLLAPFRLLEREQW